MIAPLAVLLGFLLASTGAGRRARPPGIRVRTINTHGPAGATGHNGDGSGRSTLVRGLLLVSWNLWWAALRRAVRAAVKAGCCVVVTMDANDPHVDVRKLHPRARIVAQHGPDYIVVVTPNGYGAAALHQHRVPGFEGAHAALGVLLQFFAPDGTTAEGAWSFFNSGRDVAAGTITATLQRVHDQMLAAFGRALVVFAFVEIGEGDHGGYSEASLLARIWARTDWKHLLLKKRATKEPVLLRVGLYLERATTVLIRGTAVAFQSPFRRINAVGFVLPTTKERP